MLSVELLCMARSWRAMPMPRPVPPFPCSWPFPTCLNSPPSAKVATSSSVMPRPSSRTETRMQDGRVPGARKASSAALHSAKTALGISPCLASSVILSPASENLIAFETPLLRHCWTRRSSPMRMTLSRERLECAMVSEHPLASARAAKARRVERSSELSVKGLGTRTRRPVSMRSKSSTSERMPCMMVEQSFKAASCSFTACGTP
mmetsp:Transcript_3766/g.11191  ORF Transcript_3766/g.11191 Transcript_3766/m.11191 type:complete len:206 (-) Transcript_3766:85-702(-)